MQLGPRVVTADSNALCPSPVAYGRLGSRAARIFLLVAVTGCGSIYDFGDLRSGELFEHKRYSAVVPIVPGHENGVWNRTADALDSNDLLLKSKWWYESEKRLLIYKAAIRLVDTRSSIRSMADLQEHVKNGGMEGVRFSEATPAETSQAHVLCVRPPLYSETTPKEGRGHFVQLMACVDTKTWAYYELALIQDFINKGIAGTPRPSDALNVAADRFFATFKVN